MLDDTDIKQLLPDGEEKTAWENYRQALRDVPQTYEGAEAHEVPMPLSPEDEANIAARAAEGEE